MANVRRGYGAGQRIMVTGGAGFVGSHLVDVLLARGSTVVAVDNLVTGSKENLAHLAGERRFALVEADVSQPLPAVPELEARFDAIMHFASPASPVDFTRIPIEILRVGSVATLQLLERAVRDQARFVLASTSETYGDPLVHPQPETYWGNVNPIGIRSCYDEAKRFAEAATMAYVRAHGLDCGIVRIFNTYGERMRPDDGRVIPTFIAQALRGDPLTVHGTGEQTRSICYVSDLVRGIVALLDSGELGPINCGTEQEMTMRELAETIVRLAGSTSEIRYVDRPADDPERRRPDLTRASTLLAYWPRVAAEAGLRHTIEHFAGGA
ncbi:MAG: NAD-dependent epimerase/dehydratase family protein [Dactylosporangium sp.]|nr:GDP-mannose 4,6-dehydratase [Dactylosporangium sp.]NNJ61158.1 NAD-dependent epimerase/dehydratase family protein [Dactylosporangium sp.]